MSPDILPLLLWGLAALAFSSALIPACRALALRYGYVAQPREDRWHGRPTPLLGGIAIAVPALVLSAASGDFMEMAILLAAGLFMFIVGTADDLLSLKPATKLIAQIALASMFAVLRLPPALGDVADARHACSRSSGSSA